MVIKIGINGFGRIGRIVFRTCFSKPNIEISAINDPTINIEYICYLIKFDSIHGKFQEIITYSEDIITIKDMKIKVFNEKLPSSIPWYAADVHYVIEASGMFTTVEKASGHLLSKSVRRVIVTAPSVDIPMIILGVNQEEITDELIVSCASSTLYCLAPILKILASKFGIAEGFVTCIHAMTPSLKPLDGLCLRGSHWRDHRSVHQNIIPAATGACKALGKIIPEVKDKICGLAFRVPIVDVSVLDITVRLNKDTSLREIAESIEIARMTKMKNIIDTSYDDTVSSDFLDDKHSCILDVRSSLELTSRSFKLICWYENEYAYACRVMDTIKFFEELSDCYQKSRREARSISSIASSCKDKNKVHKINYKQNLLTFDALLGEKTRSSFHKQVISFKNIDDDIYKLLHNIKNNPDHNSDVLSESDSRNNKAEIMSLPHLDHISYEVGNIRGELEKVLKRSSHHVIPKDTPNEAMELENTNLKSSPKSHNIHIATKLNNININIKTNNSKINNSLTAKVDNEVYKARPQSDEVNETDIASSPVDKDSGISQDFRHNDVLRKNSFKSHNIHKTRIKNLTFKADPSFINPLLTLRADHDVNQAKSHRKDVNETESGLSTLDKESDIFEDIQHHKILSKSSFRSNNSHNKKIFKNITFKTNNSFINVAPMPSAENDVDQAKPHDEDVNKTETAPSTFDKDLETFEDVKHHDIIEKEKILRKNDNVDLDNTKDNISAHNTRDEIVAHINNENDDSKSICTSAIIDDSNKQDISNNMDGSKTQDISNHKICKSVTIDDNINKDICYIDDSKKQDIFNHIIMKRKMSLIEKTPEFFKVLNESRAQKDLYDKLDSATNSESSLQKFETKSQVLDLTDLTSSNEDLARLDKICKIIEISDELSDKLFSVLQAQGETSKKKWSLRDLCKRIELDDFCTKVFGQPI